MAVTDFGDFELGDAWDADPTIAPEQVARRIHRLRRALSELAGDYLEPFDELERRARDDAYAVAERLVALIVAGERDPHQLGAEIVDRWLERTDEERQIAIALLEAVLAWLRREGPR